MATAIYHGLTVKVDDPQDRLQGGEPISAMCELNASEATLSLTVPELKPKAKAEAKPKPVNVYTGVLANTIGTIRVDGKMQVQLQITPEKAKSLGKTTLNAELRGALDAVYDRAVG